MKKDTRVISMRMPLNLLKKIKEMAEKEHRTVTTEIIHQLEKVIKK